ncbi:unnamed protein product, partial [Heterotrigona itama]
IRFKHFKRSSIFDSSLAGIPSSKQASNNKLLLTLTSVCNNSQRIFAFSKLHPISLVLFSNVTTASFKSFCTAISIRSSALSFTTSSCIISKHLRKLISSLALK